MAVLCFGIIIRYRTSTDIENVGISVFTKPYPPENYEENPSIYKCRWKKKIAI